MQTIGTTNTGNYLVEMTNQEHRIFIRLAQATDGQSSDSWFMRDNPEIHTDFSGIFGAIHAFTIAQFRVNELRHMVDELQAALERQE